jgi:hypothetical protein
VVDRGIGRAQRIHQHVEAGAPHQQPRGRSSARAATMDASGRGTPIP